MKRILVILFTINYSLFTVECYARLRGQALTDSLLAELPKQKEDTNKANLLLRICARYKSNKPDETIIYATEALAISKKLNWPDGMLNAYATIGGAYGNKGDNAKALENYTIALTISKEINDTNAISGMYMNIGMVYEGQKNSPKALEYYYKALKGFEEIGNKEKMVGITNNIGNVYYDLKNYTKALDYYTKALEGNQQLGNHSWEAFNLNNIGIVYNDLKDFPRALDYYFKAMKINEEQGDTATMGINLTNIGYVYHQQKKYSTAFFWYGKALAVANKTGNKQLGANITGNVGETYLRIATDTSGAGQKPDSVVRMGRARILDRAANHAKLAIAVYMDIGDVGSLREFTSTLSEIYYELGNYSEALKWYKQSTAFKDSVFNADNSVRVSNLETQREMDLKDKQIQIDELAVAKKRNERGFFVAGITGLLFVVVLTFKGYKTQRTSNKLLSIEKQKSEDLLLNILPTQVANELKEKGIAEAKHFDNVTVLFTDFVNFTEAGERMTPKELVDELHNCFKAFDDILGKYWIEKIKTVGDAYIAVSGLPISNPAHATQIVKAAKDILDFMLQRQQQLGNDTFGIRIGIHSGSVVAGIVGVKKFAYDIWGDTVNTAARMEQNSEAGKINISETTYALVKDKFSCEYRGEVEAKGKGVMKMYFVS